MAFVTDSRWVSRLEVEARGYRDSSVLTQLSRDGTEASGPLGPCYPHHDPLSEAVGVAALCHGEQPVVWKHQIHEPSPGWSRQLQLLTEGLWSSHVISPDRGPHRPFSKNTCERSLSQFSSLRVPPLREQIRPHHLFTEPVGSLDTVYGF